MINHRVPGSYWFNTKTKELKWHAGQKAEKYISDDEVHWAYSEVYYKVTCLNCKKHILNNQSNSWKMLNNLVLFSYKNNEDI